MPRVPLSAVLVWIAAALFALGAWLSLARERGGPSTPVRVVLVDVSASAIGERVRAERLRSDLASLGIGRAPDGIEVRGVLFGNGARSFDAARGPDDADLARGEDRSDLAAALRLAAEIAGDRLESIDVVGDGTWTGEDPAPFAAELAARGLPIRVTRSSARVDSAAYVAPLASPIRVRRGEAPRVDYEFWRWIGEPPGHARPDPSIAVEATLTEADRSGTRSARFDLARSERGPFARRASFRFEPLASRGASLEIRAELRDADGTSAGAPVSVARAIVVADGALVVGTVGTPRARAAFERAVSAVNDGFAFAAIDDPRGDLAAFDVIVTLDAEFDRERAAAIDAFVASGGGWLDVAGETFADGRRPSCAPLVPAGDDGRPREIVVLVDASGSMAGAPAVAARTALARLVESARVEDGVSARWFSDGATAAIDLGRPGARADAAERRAALERVTAAPEPRGPTRVWSALDALERDLDEARSTLAILVSDGREPDRNDVASRAAALRSRFEARGARLVAVAAGAEPDVEFLRALVGDASDVHAAGDLDASDAAAQLARLLRRAAASGSVVDVPSSASTTYVGGDAALAAGLATLVPPSLARRARARAADGASVAWSADGAPVLALARRGLGVAANRAYALDDAWLRASNDDGAALATVLRAVAPPADRGRLRMREADGELVLENVPDGAPAIVRAELAGADGTDLGTVELVAARAGRDPLRDRSGRIPARVARLASGALVRARVPDPTGVGEPLELTFAAPRAPEFARAPEVFVPPTVDGRRRAPTGPGPSPHAAWVLVTGVAALAGAVAAGFFSRSGR